MRLCVHIRRTDFLRIAALAVLVMNAGACSSLPTVPDWVDPTTWFGGNDNAPDNGQTPDLAGIPQQPQATKPDEQQEVAESLATDRAHANYSADVLRGGTEVAAAPPPDVAVAQAAQDETAVAAGRSRRTAAASSPTVRTAQVDRSIAQNPTGRTMPGTLPATPPASQVAQVEMPAPAPTAEAQAPAPTEAPAPAAPTATAEEAPTVSSAKPIQTAAAATGEETPAKPAPARHRPHKPVRTAAVPAPEPSIAEPAVSEPVTPAPRAPSRRRIAAAEMPAPSAPPPPVPQAMISPSDAALGFKPSSAPPLDPSVSQFVAAPVVQRYQQTAANAGMAYSAPTAYAENSPAYAAPRFHRSNTGAHGVGGPEQMTGAVVANLDVLGPSTPTPTPVYADAQGTPATAVIFFPGDRVTLNAEGRDQVVAAIDQFKTGGGTGFIRVVGHASSRTPDMPVARHMEIVQRRSQLRADAVAREIIRLGVPADRVQVEAVGDSQPVYYESMPKGEEGNRRVEIYVQN